MSLVDYASSSSEEEEEEEKNLIADEHQPKLSAAQQPPVADEALLRCRSEATITPPPAPQFDPPRPHATPIHKNERSGSSVNKRGEEVSKGMEAPVLKLPDASLLLSSPALPSHLANATDHSSRVAAAMAESESRKRDLNGSSSSSHTRSKVPRGNLPHSKRVPDTEGGHLHPPQLTGRSNIVTEDISKLFVKRHVDSSSREMKKKLLICPQGI